MFEVIILLSSTLSVILTIIALLWSIHNPTFLIIQFFLSAQLAGANFVKCNIGFAERKV